MIKILPIITALLLTNNILAQTNGPVVIPVVFHILSRDTNASENISTAQILSAIRILNQDYNNTNTDSAIIAPAYRNNVANMGITFKLAGIDPNGFCTDGIDRIVTTQADSGGTKDGYVNDWPREKYLNIWTYRRFPTEAAGQTWPPWYALGIPAQDGIAILNYYVGSIGTSSIGTSRALTNLTGEYFGLIPSWGSGAFGSCEDLDSVADTPPVSGPSSYYISNCDTDILSCDGHSYINYQNYMSYSYCICMFTNGQKQRVYSYLNRSAAGRNNLWTTANLTATGTNDSVAVVCSPAGIQNITENTLSVFPNPFNSQISIQGLQAGNYNIALTDITGRNLLTFNNIFTDGAGNATLNLSAIPIAGIYFIRIYNTTNIATLKIVKQ